MKTFLILFYIFTSFSSFEAPSVLEPPEVEAPKEIKGVYLTAWTAVNRTDEIIQLTRETEINALIIDVKDFSGEVFLPIEESYGRVRPLISPSLIERLKEEDLYLIARVTVFQDPVLAKARPDLALKTREGLLWKDNLGLEWIDPGAEESWGYYVHIAKKADEIGFDEINFDYIRFPSDGSLREIVYPFFDGQSRRETIAKFYAYVRENLPESKISASIFGLTTTAQNDLGVGQFIEDAFLYFDFVTPMIYPSHYAPYYLGKENPTRYPYEVVFHSLNVAKTRGEPGKLRPWLQDFSIRGVSYGKEEVEAQIRATRDALGKNYGGYLLWSSRNVYTREALKIED